MKWIRVKDELPAVGQRVLVYEKDGVFGGHEIDIAQREHGFYPDVPANNSIIWNGQGICNYIHFWMPLPEPPKEDGSNVR